MSRRFSFFSFRLSKGFRTENGLTDTIISKRILEKWNGGCELDTFGS
jgi:hypothetical protein